MWRNFETHGEETKAVKDALAKARIKANVGHGRGTAWGWLEINIGPDKTKHARRGDNGQVVYMTHVEANTSERYYPCLGDCPACEKRRVLRSRIYSIVLAITGRRQEDSRILILEQ